MNATRRLVISILTVSLFGLFSISAAVSAQMTPPDEVVKTTIQSALQQLEERRDELSKDNQKLYAAVEKVLQPAIHFERFSKLVLGKHWRKATADQKKEFVAQFKKSLLKTYATAIFEYSGETINYIPLEYKGGDRVKVKTEFVTKSGSVVPVIYSMSNKDDDRWRVYDIKIITPETSTSLVQLYRSQYNSLIESKGLDGLISDLQKKNDV